MRCASSAKSRGASRKRKTAPDSDLPDVLNLQSAWEVYQLDKPRCTLHSVPNPKTQNCRDNPYCLARLGQQKWDKIQQKIEKDSRVNALTNDRRDVAKVPCGLVNVGNSCYVNSFLQIYFNDPKFRRCIYEWQPVESFVQPPGVKVNIEELMLCLQKLFVTLQITPFEDTSAEDFVKLLKLDGALQQDAAEFHTLLFDKLEKLLSLREEWRDIRDVIANRYHGSMTETLSCPCGRYTVKPVPFTYLLLHIDKVNSLSKALELLFTPERMPEFTCPMCRQYETTMRTFSLTEIPPVITFQMQRNAFDVNVRNKKVQSAVQYPRTLDLAGKAYECIAVLVHDGPFSDSGHFYDLIKHPVTEKWFTYNDEVVKEAAGPVGVLSEKDRIWKATPDMKGCYVLIYRHMDEELVEIPEVPEHLRQLIAPKLEKLFQEKTSASTESSARWSSTVEARRDRLIDLWSQLEVKNGRDAVAHPEEIVFVPVDLLMEIQEQEFNAVAEKKERVPSTNKAGDVGTAKENEKTGKANGHVEHEEMDLYKIEPISSFSFSLCSHRRVSLESVRNGEVKAVRKDAAIRMLEKYGLGTFCKGETLGTERLMNGSDICLQCVTELKEKIEFNTQLDSREKLAKQLLRERKKRYFHSDNCFWVSVRSLQQYRKLASRAREQLLHSDAENVEITFSSRFSDKINESDDVLDLTSSKEDSGMDDSFRDLFCDDAEEDKPSARGSVLAVKKAESSSNAFVDDFCSEVDVLILASEKETAQSTSGIDSKRDSNSDNKPYVDRDETSGIDPTVDSPSVDVAPVQTGKHVLNDLLVPSGAKIVDSAAAASDSRSVNKEGEMLICSDSKVSEPSGDFEVIVDVTQFSMDSEAFVEIPPYLKDPEVVVEVSQCGDDSEKSAELPEHCGGDSEADVEMVQQLKECEENVEMDSSLKESEEDVEMAHNTAVKIPEPDVEMLSILKDSELDATAKDSEAAIEVQQCLFSIVEEVPSKKRKADSFSPCVAEVRSLTCGQESDLTGEETLPRRFKDASPAGHVPHSHLKIQCEESEREPKSEALSPSDFESDDVPMNGSTKDELLRVPADAFRRLEETRINQESNPLERPPSSPQDRSTSALSSNKEDQSDGEDEEEEQKLAVFNGDLRCKHGKFDFEGYNTKERRVVVDAEEWAFLTEGIFGVNQIYALSADESPCEECELNFKNREFDREVKQQHISAIKSSVGDVIRSVARRKSFEPPSGQSYTRAICATFLKNMIARFKSGSRNLVVPRLCQECILCPDHKLPYLSLESESKAVPLTLDEWKKILAALNIEEKAALTVAIEKGSFVDFCDICYQKKLIEENNKRFVYERGANIYVKLKSDENEEPAKENGSPVASSTEGTVSSSFRGPHATTRRAVAKSCMKFYLTSNDSILHLKQKICERIGQMPVDQLLYMSDRLLTDSLTLEEARIDPRELTQNPLTLIVQSMVDIPASPRQLERGFADTALS